MYSHHSALKILSAAGLAMVVTMGTAEARQVCKPMVWGYGLHANQNISKLHALGAWTTKAKNSYGVAYGSYGAAKSKSQNCRREGAGPNAKYNCVVKGRPCANVWGPSGKESG